MRRYCCKWGGSKNLAGCRLVIRVSEGLDPWEGVSFGLPALLP